MPLFTAAIALLCVAYSAGQYLAERKRLAVLRGLPGPQARDHYERFRKRYDRQLLIVTICACAAAAGTFAYASWLGEISR